MNLGKGLLIPQENGVTNNGIPWIPVTPEKQPVMQRSNPILAKMQGNQTESTNCPVSIYSMFRSEKPATRRSNPTPAEVQANQMASMNDQELLKSDRLLLERPVMKRPHPNLSEIQKDQTKWANWQDMLEGHDGCLSEELTMQSSNPIYARMQGNQRENGNQQKSLGIYSIFSPENPVTQPSIPVISQMQGNQTENTSWQDLIGLYSGVLQETRNSDPLQNFKSNKLLGNGEHNTQGGAAVEGTRCFNQNADSYLQNCGKGIPLRNNNLQVELSGIMNAPYRVPADAKINGSVCATNSVSIASPYSPTGNNWKEHQSSTSMLLQQNSKHGISICSLQQNLSDGFPVSYRPCYNLNSPPRVETPAASCATTCFQIAPVTSEQGKQFKHHQLSDIEKYSIIESPSQEKDKQETISTDRQDVGNHYDELLHCVIPSPSISNSTTLKEKKISEDGTYGVIDLNKTPQQKAPKRKKHRPKVVVEGKPKRMPKPAASKTNIPIETPPGKRKYVRRKGLETSNSKQDNETNGVDTSALRSAAKSCRRMLNFNSEEKTQEKIQGSKGNVQEEKHHESFDLNLNSQETASSTNLVGASVKNQLDENAPTNAPTGPSATVRDHTLNVIARSLNLQNGSPYQTNDHYGYGQVHQHMHGEAVGQMILQANATWAMLDKARQLMLQSRTEPVKEKRGCKRNNSHTHCQTVNLMHSQFPGDPKKDGSKSGSGTSQTCKKKKLGHTSHGVASNVPSCTAATKDSPWQVESGGSNGVHASNSSYINGRLPNSNLDTLNTSRKEMIGADGIIDKLYTHHMAVGNNCQEPRSLSEENLHRDWKTKKISKQNTESCSPNLLTAITYQNLLSAPQRVSTTIQGNETTTSQVYTSVKTQTVAMGSSMQTVSKEKLLLKENKKEMANRRSSSKARGPKEEQKYATTIDEVINQLKGLQISNSGQIVGEQTAIVPYKGDSTIVPYKEVDPIPRRKPRPKVDLDPETNRLWNLLMGKSESESTEAMDKEKEKWWEEERAVFRGRVDSFIARMHLVQGDRRFSEWKGSVVDSVIGVFLTQNVSDHLSSSAFMSLAAAFPLSLTTMKRACCQNQPSAWIEEPEVQIIDPDGTITYHGRMLKQPICKQMPTTSSESSEQRSENLITEAGIDSVKENKRGPEEEVVSSQNSADSFIYQVSEDVRNSSDSEVEDQIIMCNSNHSPKSIPQTERAANSQQYQMYAMKSPLLDKKRRPGYQQLENPASMRQNPGSHIGSKVYAYPIKSNLLCLQESVDPSTGLWLNDTLDSGVHESYSSSPSGKQSMSSFLLSAVEVTKMGGVAHARKSIGTLAESLSSSTIQEIGMRINQELRMDQNSYSENHANSQPECDIRSSQQSVNSNQKQSFKSFDLESKSATETRRPDNADSKRQSGDTYPPSKQLSIAGSNITNAGKRKSEVNKPKAFDWDTLRKQVLEKGVKKERGKDKMDSLDYEALRHADVKKISDTIKERGMNNMLAERIKDFLNRLVRDHGSIDLEWLRDVPPEKAKDYLLSIRGLGLKSVECVRLLSLQNMGFPVDTNVGRIAVRLGWVPLQPLPESLQLHLLELYPVLESIQKYLWPRLCKLDQRALYELHYQMITFGKVFCTKSKPNCNACPMRGECRHFASAFASARLALPGPEERSIVSSTTPIATYKDHTVIVEPIPLPPTEIILGRESQYCSGKCEPIIEEPTTPEPSIEVTQSDIEDMPFEDPDEIPTIKLSLEELKMNVQSIIQEQNIEISEGDLSRALVALDPAAASLPAPKLKNVSRLRTEHQVYELPDSHPILKEMERREPDDPSPYLLAIWTPGETAHSIQPPESNCSCQGSDRLCSEKTCFSCDSIREADSHMVRGTLLIPCRTAMRGSFPLNGTYFQVNEVFADHESSKNPINVPREWIWHLPRRTVYFGTSVTTIFRGMSMEGIQYCFWRGFVCVRGFDQKTRGPRPLMARLHYPASRMTKNKKEDK